MACAARQRMGRSWAGWLALAVCGQAAAQGLEYVKEHYTKYEHRIPMRDGKMLFTSVYVPKDRSQSYPVLLTRTPYSVRPYGVDQYRSDLGPSSFFGKEGYIFAYQDVRGRWKSEGEFIDMRPMRVEPKGPSDVDESTDAWDTIDWLVKHVPGNNGKVGLTGISYPGFYTSTGLINAHPALKAASPQAPIVDWFEGDDWHHNGAFILAHIFGFMSTQGRPRPTPTASYNYTFDYGTPDGYAFFLRMGSLANANAKYFKNEVAFWNEAMQHGTYDAFWKSRNLRPHLKDIRPAVLTVGGWFDAENLFGALETYKRIEAASPQTFNALVMGPWSHGAWSRSDGDSLGYVSFNSKTGEFYREKIEFPFFQHYLKGKGELKHPEAWVFETGTNQWRAFDAWPPREVQHKSLYLSAAGRLSPEAPTEEEGPRSWDEYTSDPANPVPYINRISTALDATYVVADQRFASCRPDVLVYSTLPLEREATVVGPIEVELFVSTSGTDCDWVVKLIDVYPDDLPDAPAHAGETRLGGFEQLVRGDVMRGKFRNSLEKPEPFVPGEPTQVRFKLHDICHTFRLGHRVMVQIQSSWFPLVDRNPQKFLDIYNARDEDFQKTAQRVYHSPNRPSRLVFQVLP